MYLLETIDHFRVFFVLVVDDVVYLHHGLLLQVGESVQDACDRLLEESALGIGRSALGEQFGDYSGLVFFLPFLPLLLLPLVTVELFKQNTIALVLHFDLLLRGCQCVLELPLTCVFPEILEFEQAVYLGYLILLTDLVLPSFSAQVDFQTHKSISLQPELFLVVALVIQQPS